MELSTYLSSLRRHWLTVLVTLLVVTGLAGLATVLMPKTYSSSASVLVSVDGAQSISDLSSASNYLTDAMPTYASLGTSSLVLDPVVKKLGLNQSSADLAKAVTVEQEPETFVMTVSVEGDAPQRVADTAQAVADTLATAIPQFNRTGEQAGKVIPPKVTVTSLTKADVPESASSPKLPVNLAVGAVLGALIGCALAVLRGGSQVGESFAAAHRRQE